MWINVCGWLDDDDNVLLLYASNGVENCNAQKTRRKQKSERRAIGRRRRLHLCR